MWSLIRRAKTLGKLSDGQYKRLCQTLSAQGHRMQEPITIEGEEPSVIPEIIKAYRDDMGYSDDELLKITLTGRKDLYEHFLPTTLRIAQGADSSGEMKREISAQKISRRAQQHQFDIPDGRR